VPALALLAVSAAVIHAICRRPALQRLGLALHLVALAASLELFHYLVRGTDWLAPYAHTLALFAALYTAYKIGEIVVCDVVAVRRGRSRPPSILRDVASAVFCALVLIFLLRATFGLDVTALVATSAALSIVLGLAMQETLANLFAGLALMIERPFEPGDWVRFGDRVGRVTEVSWRAVKLKLIRQEDYLVVPNSVVAKHEIVNLSQPTPLHGQTLDVPVVLTEPPNRVRQALIEAALQVDGVLSDPLPKAGVLRFEPGAVFYRLTYWIQDFSRALDIEGQVPTHIWYAFRRAGVRIPFPVSDVRWRDAALTEAGERQTELDRLTRLLRGVDFLAAMTSEELDRLALGARLVPYPAGMTVVRQGDGGDSLFVIASGRVEIAAHSVVGRGDRVLAVLGAGDYFGEMSLLTGAPRSATCRSLVDAELLILTADALRPLLVQDPAAADRLSQAMARRKAFDEEVIPVATGGMAPAPPDLPHVLLGRIRHFFGLTGTDA
jgi:small-conductance mechanosensitive channel